MLCRRTLIGRLGVACGLVALLPTIVFITAANRPSAVHAADAPAPPAPLAPVAPAAPAPPAANPEQAKPAAEPAAKVDKVDKADKADKNALDAKPDAKAGDAEKPKNAKDDAEAAKKKDKEAARKSKLDAIGKALDEKPVREREPGENPLEDRGGKDGPNPKESVLVWLYNSMGTRYVIIFLGVTFNEIALVVMIVLGLRRKCICPLDLVETFEQKLDAKQYQEAYDTAKANNSFLGKVLAAGMANLSEGHEAALEAMHEVGEEQNMRLEQRNGHIALIAQLGPMLGLLATVDGIVRAFAVIAGKDVTPKPSELAQGIGIALVNTVVGLWLAIPSIVFYHLIRNRLSRMVLEVGVISTRLMKRFSKVSTSVVKSSTVQTKE